MDTIESLQRRVRDLERELEKHRTIIPFMAECRSCMKYFPGCSFQRCVPCDARVCNKCERRCSVCDVIVCIICQSSCTTCGRTQCLEDRESEQGNCFSCLCHLQQQKITYFALELCVSPLILDTLFPEFTKALERNKCQSCFGVFGRRGYPSSQKICTACTHKLSGWFPGAYGWQVARFIDPRK